MKVLEGLLLINGIDVYKQYGAFLTEKENGGHENIDALFTPSGLKEQTAVDIREEDGEKLPDELIVKFKPRDVTLKFAISAANRSDFLIKWSSFRSFLKEGENGWLTFHFPEIDMDFRFYLKDFPAGYEQLSFSNDGCVSRFPVTFREPKPKF